jgi:hypothetical protein
MTRGKTDTASGFWARMMVLVFLLRARSDVLAGEVSTDFQYDPVEDWAARMLTWVLVVGLILAGYCLYRSARGRLHGPAGKTLMLVSVVLLPGFSIAAGMLLVFTRAASVEFCSSCHHVMQAYADDMKQADGSGLAAVHYANRYISTNQCYECHTRYGLFGTLEAKIHGMGEVFRYYTGTYELPIEMWEPYSNGDCLKCHAKSRKWLAVDAHTDGDGKADLFDDRVSCMKCHDSAHRVRSAGAGEAAQ